MPSFELLENASFPVASSTKVFTVVASGIGERGADAATTPIPANTALGNFTGSTALPIAQDKNDWISWLDVPTNFMFNTFSSTVFQLGSDLVDLEGVVATKADLTDPRFTNARDWNALSITQAEAEAGTEVIDRRWSALRVRQSARVNPDFDPTGNLFTIGTTTNSQRLRLRRRFVSASDFSQLSIDFSGDVCRIQTQQTGNNPNPITIGTNGVERLFLGSNGFLGIGASAVNRHLEVHTSVPAMRLQVTSVTTPPVYAEQARAFDIVTYQDANSPFNTVTDIVANSNQFNAHAIRVFVHTSGVSAPVLHSVFHSSGRLSIGDGTDDGVSRLRVVGNTSLTGTLTLGASGVLQGGTNLIQQVNGTNSQRAQWFNTFISATNLRAFQIDATDTNNIRIGSIVGSLGGTTMGLQFGRTDAGGAWATWLGISASGVVSIGTYSLPSTDGTVNQVLQTNGAGVLSFGSVQKTITSGTAAPSGGVDGDIYLQYTI